MKIIVTGAQGLIGSELLKTLNNNKSFELYPVVMKKHENQNPINEYIECDLSKEIDFSKFPKSPDVIIHLAQSDNYQYFPDRALNIFNVNTSSTLQLLDYARFTGAKKFILASSGGIYGTSVSPFSEDDVITLHRAPNYYLATKAIDEILCKHYEQYFCITILRIFFAYGKGQNQNMLIPRLISSVKSRLPIFINKFGGTKINPVYVSDVVNTINKAIDTSGSVVYNISGNEILSIKEIAENISNSVGIDPVWEIRDSEEQNVIGDNTKMKQELHCPTVTFEQGLKYILN